MRFRSLLLLMALVGCATPLREATLEDAWNYQLEQQTCVDIARAEYEADICRLESWRKCQATFVGGCPAPMPR